VDLFCALRQGAYRIIQVSTTWWLN